MKSTHTQALFDELKTPKHACRVDAEDAVLAFFPILTKLSQQASEDVSLAQTAEIAETDEELRGKLELFIQTAGAQKRIVSELEKHLRDLVATLRQRDRYDQLVRPVAKARGYKG
jgi:hypothetical protein